MSSHSLQSEGVISLTRLAYLIAGISLVLVALGGYVRGTGAGLSCPDWPLCYGKAVPPDFGNGVFQEVVHRYIASAVSVLTLIFAVLAYKKRLLFPLAWQGALFSLVVLLFQVILGGLTVLMLLNPFIVTGHLALGTVFFQTFAFLAFALQPSQRPNPLSGVSRRTLIAALLLTYIQLLLGGFVGSSGAALACPDLPHCFGTSMSLLPENHTHQQEIHMMHRLLAVLVFVILALVAIRERVLSGNAQRVLWTALVVTTLQILLGVSNVYFRVPVSVAVLHLVVAQVLLLLLLRAYALKRVFAANVMFSPSSNFSGAFTPSHNVQEAQGRL